MGHKATAVALLLLSACLGAAISSLPARARDAPSIVLAPAEPQPRPEPAAAVDPDKWCAAECDQIVPANPVCAKLGCWMCCAETCRCKTDTSRCEDAKENCAAEQVKTYCPDIAGKAPTPPK